ncbi:MAG: cation transporter [Clostridia bacterium]|nr:cation transporter [Clostridia bacterium]
MDRYKSAKIASIFGIVGNIFLLIIKGSIGFITNSQAMIADSVNSAGDIFSSFMTFIGNKIASKPRDDSHNLGHGKAEYIFSMLISLSMILIAIKLLFSSIDSLMNPNNYSFSWMLIVVCIVTIATKFSLYIYTHSLSKKFNNLLIEANAKDHRNDCIVTTFNLIAALLSLKNILWFDGVVGIGISVWICYTGVKIFIESYNVLMDKAISEEDKQKVLAIIEKHPEVKKIQHFNSTPVGYKYQISFTIYVDGNLSTYESHEIANNLEEEIDREIDEVYLTVIHVNPI